MKFEEALQRLKDGNDRFQHNKFAERKTDSDFRRELAEGQSPYAAILSCADSRVAPELVFDSDLGELFVVRVAGNIANSSSIASLEYTVDQLGTSLIVVLGHQSCGAVSAAASGFEGSDHLNKLLASIQPAIDKVEDRKDIDSIVIQNAKESADALVKQSGIIRSKVESGELKIIPAYYHLHDGSVDFLN